jgi:predicted N-acetyltransferase YhbS
MLGDRAASIGCVGVAAARDGHGIGTALVASGAEILRDRGARVCHISWTTRASFYESLGYRRWRSYRMYRRP